MTSATFSSGETGKPIKTHRDMEDVYTGAQRQSASLHLIFNNAEVTKREATVPFQWNKSGNITGKTPEGWAGGSKVWDPSRPKPTVALQRKRHAETVLPPSSRERTQQNSVVEGAPQEENLPVASESEKWAVRTDDKAITSHQAPRDSVVSILRRRDVNAPRQSTGLSSGRRIQFKPELQSNFIFDHRKPSCEKIVPTSELSADEVERSRQSLPNLAFEERLSDAVIDGTAEQVLEIFQNVDWTVEVAKEVKNTYEYVKKEIAENERDQMSAAETREKLTDLKDKRILFNIALVCTKISGCFNRSPFRPLFSFDPCSSVYYCEPCTSECQFGNFTSTELEETSPIRNTSAGTQLRMGIREISVGQGGQCCTQAG